MKIKKEHAEQAIKRVINDATADELAEVVLVFRASGSVVVEEMLVRIYVEVGRLQMTDENDS